MNKKNLALLVFLLLPMYLTSCTSSQKDDEGTGEEEVLSDEASTDAVPEGDGDALAVGEEDSLGGEEGGDAVADEAPPAGDALAGGEEPPADLSAPEAAPLVDVSQAPPALAEAPSDAPPPAPPADVAAAPVPAPATGGSGEVGEYTVQPGDTLMKIAFEQYGDLYRWKEIASMNAGSVSDPNRIRPGMVLKIPPSSSPSIDRNGEKHLIRPGETLGTIARDVYGNPKKWRKIYENNRQLIKDPNRIYAGFHLYYMPDGSAPATPTEPEVPSSPVEGEPLGQNQPAPGQAMPAIDRGIASDGAGAPPAAGAAPGH